VTITPRGEVLGSFWVEKETADGFTIVMRNRQDYDIAFNWHAFASPDAKLTVSDGSSWDVKLSVDSTGSSDNTGQAAEASTEVEPPTGAVDSKDTIESGDDKSTSILPDTAEGQHLATVDGIKVDEIDGTGPSEEPEQNKLPEPAAEAEPAPASLKTDSLTPVN
jgi:hypothetical protein